MTLPVSFPFTGTPSLYSGTGTSELVPDVFPVALNGRPYMVDLKSGYFNRQLDARVRDSQDISTAPGESAINPQGFWRRGQNSWHLGAGQQYSDVAASTDYRFYKSKGVNPWTKGRLTLLNDVKTSYSQTSSTANVRVISTQNAVFITDGTAVKYSTDPFASSPTWTTVSGLPSLQARDIATDGSNVYLTYAGLTSSYGLWKIDASYTASNVAYGHEFGKVGYAKGRLIVGANYSASPVYGEDIYYDPAGNVTTDSDEVKITPWQWVGFASGQGAIYAAGHSGSKSVIYKITITSSGVLDKLVAALELPNGEIVSAIHGYLGYIIVGTNKGVRFCTADSAFNLVAGALIPTSGSVNWFTSDDRFVWFTWSNYDGESTGLGRLDLSNFTVANTPAYATDLMRTGTEDVLSCASFNSKRLFTVKGIGLVVEDSSNLVASGHIETGVYQWGIPDRKFAPRFETRVEPLDGSVSLAVSIENQAYVDAGTHDNEGQTEHEFFTPETKFIQVQYKITLNRGDATTGPTFLRWMASAFAAPKRSRIITLPLVIQERHSIRGRDYYFDVALERDLLEELALDPSIVTYQEKDDTFSVIVEDAKWIPFFTAGNDWLWEGTMVMTLRTITE